MSETQTIEKPAQEGQTNQEPQAPEPQATNNEPTLQDLITKDPAKAEKEILQLREEAKNNRLKAREYESKMEEIAKKEAEEKEKKLLEDKKYEELIAEKNKQIEELSPFKDKFETFENDLKKTLTEKLEKIEKPELKTLIENSNLPLQERLKMADSFLDQKPQPAPAERGRATVSPGQEPPRQNNLYDPNR